MRRARFAMGTAFAACSLLIGLLVAVIFGCAPATERHEPRLVLVYATCSLNRELLSPYRSTADNHAVADTPSIQRFADRAIVFQRHQTESGQSGTSFASLFTGYQAPVHKIYSHPQRIPRDIETIGLYFQRAGYTAYSWLEHLMAGSPLGYARGVPVTNQQQTKLTANDPDFLALLDRLAAHPEERAFVVTNFTVTHGPYRGIELKRYCERHPEACEPLASEGATQLRRFYEREHINLSWNYEATVAKGRLSGEERDRLDEIVSILYAVGVERLDRLFGEVISAIEERGLTQETIVVFTADHGEVGIRPGLPFRWTHGMQLAPDVLNVPAMIFAPGQGIEPRVYESVTRSIDVLPTLLSLAGIPSTDLPGVNLAAAIRNEEPAPALTAFSHTALLPAVFYQNIDRYPLLQDLYPEWKADYMRVGLRRGDEFFELSPRRQGEGLEPALYDIALDKGKERNLYDPADPRHQSALRDLALYRARLIDAYGPVIRDLRLPAKEEESRLRALGYIE